MITPDYETSVSDLPLGPTDQSQTSQPQNARTASDETATNPLCTAATILLWYGLSNSIILSTKWLFSNYFSYPLTVTVYSNVVTSIWALLLSHHPKWRIPRPNRTQIRSFILPIGLTMGLEIGCSNLALKILSVSFGTILKGGAPVFTFLWGYLFGVEVFSLQLLGCLLVIATGIILATLGEGQEFQLAGFCLQLFSISLGGLRWALTHKLLQDETIANRDHSHSKLHKSDHDVETPPIFDQHHDPQEQQIHALSPLAAILYTSPVTALCVLPFALGLEAFKIWEQEGVASYNNNTEYTNTDNSTEFAELPDNVDGRDPAETALILVTMTAIATLVFCLLMSEYWLVKATSSLALSVAGVLKELMTIGGGIFFFSERVDWLNVVGFFTCQVGIVSYVCLRYKAPAVEVYVPVAEEDTTGLAKVKPDAFLNGSNGEMELSIYKDESLDSNGDVRNHHIPPID